MTVLYNKKIYDSLVFYKNQLVNIHPKRTISGEYIQLFKFPNKLDFLKDLK